MLHDKHNLWLLILYYILKTNWCESVLLYLLFEILVGIVLYLYVSFSGY